MVPGWRERIPPGGIGGNKIRSQSVRGRFRTGCFLPALPSLFPGVRALGSGAIPDQLPLGVARRAGKEGRAAVCAARPRIARHILLERSDPRSGRRSGARPGSASVAVCRGRFRQAATDPGGGPPLRDLLGPGCRAVCGSLARVTHLPPPPSKQAVAGVPWSTEAPPLIGPTCQTSEALRRPLLGERCAPTRHWLPTSTGHVSQGSMGMPHDGQQVGRHGPDRPPRPAGTLVLPRAPCKQPLRHYGAARAGLETARQRGRASARKHQRPKCLNAQEPLRTATAGR
jgi:hypothetical protein